MRLFSRVQPLMKLEVDQKSSSLRRRSDEAFLSCAAADEAGSGSEKLFSQTSQVRLFSRVQPLMKLEVDQKSSSLRRRSDEVSLVCSR